MSLWTSSLPAGGVAGRSCMDHCTASTRPLRRAAHLASSSALCYSHCLQTGSGAAAPEITLHCSASKAGLLSQGGSRQGQHAGTDTCQRTHIFPAKGLGRAASWSCCLEAAATGTPTGTPMTRWFFVAFQKRILKFGATLQNEPSGPGDSSGNAPLPVALGEAGRKSDSCLVSCLPSPAGDWYKHVWLTLCTVIYLVVSLSRVYHAIWLCKCECKGSVSVVVAVGITKTAEISLI